MHCSMRRNSFIYAELCFNLFRMVLYIMYELNTECWNKKPIPANERSVCLTGDKPLNSYSFTCVFLPLTASKTTIKSKEHLRNLKKPVEYLVQFLQTKEGP